MTAQFTDIAEYVFNEIDDILVLLLFREVTRGIKTYADRRICQIILHAVSTEPDKAVLFEGMGLIRILSYDGPSMATPYCQHIDLVDRHGGVTYCDHDMHHSDDDFTRRACSEEISFVASQVIAEGNQGFKIRFRRQSASASDLIMTSRTHLQFCCTQPSGPRCGATILDNVIIEPDAHQGEERGVILSQLGSSFAIQQKIAEADNDAAAAAFSAFTELPFPQTFWFELVYIDTPVSLLLRGLPDWKVNDPDRWTYYGYESDDYYWPSYDDIDSDSDY